MAFLRPMRVFKGKTTPAQSGAAAAKRAADGAMRYRAGAGTQAAEASQDRFRHDAGSPGAARAVGALLTAIGVA